MYKKSIHGLISRRGNTAVFSERADGTVRVQHFHRGTQPYNDGKVMSRDAARHEYRRLIAQNYRPIK